MSSFNSRTTDLCWIVIWWQLVCYHSSHKTSGTLVINSQEMKGQSLYPPFPFVCVRDSIKKNQPLDSFSLELYGPECEGYGPHVMQNKGKEWLHIDVCVELKLWATGESGNPDCGFPVLAMFWNFQTKEDAQASSTTIIAFTPPHTVIFPFHQKRQKNQGMVLTSGANMLSRLKSMWGLTAASFIDRSWRTKMQTNHIIEKSQLIAKEKEKRRNFFQKLLIIMHAVNTVTSYFSWSKERVIPNSHVGRTKRRQAP